MERERSLFDQLVSENENISSTNSKKEDSSVERLKNLEEKITSAVEKVRALKEEKIALEKKITELENLLNEKNQEIEFLHSEKSGIKKQVEDLLGELETLEL
jgi:chromosome segregation ATPase